MLNNLKYLILNSEFFHWALKLRLKYINRNRRIFYCNEHLFKYKIGVEIGGKSFVFSEDGPVPFYKVIQNLDNINFCDQTFWGTYTEGENFIFNPKKQIGKQIIADATNLSILQDNSYDFMFSSHVIEHIANPIKALFEWKRIIKTSGYLVIIAPNMRYTYDRKRPLTKFDHILDDYLKDTLESDSTHFEEVIKMHDIDFDSTVNLTEEHIKRTLENSQTRIVHHHTFQMPLLISIVEYCGFKIIDKQSFAPYHLIVIAKKI